MTRTRSRGHRRSTRRALLAALLGAFGLVSCVSAPPLVEATTSETSFTTEASLAPYTLGPGDTLSLTVYGHPQFADPQVPLRIDPLGELHLPLIGGVELAGKTLGEARGTIEAALARFLVEPTVGISVREYAARRAYVLGEVGRPGAIVLDRPLTSLQALTLAGGVSEGGDRHNVALMRVVAGELQVHFFDAATPGVAGLMVVQPEDMLFVRQSKGGVFKEQVVPVLQAAAPIFSSITNMVVILNALSD